MSFLYFPSPSSELELRKIKKACKKLQGFRFAEREGLVSRSFSSPYWGSKPKRLCLFYIFRRHQASLSDGK
jgi:hypothetical protein